MFSKTNDQGAPEPPTWCPFARILASFRAEVRNPMGAGLLPPGTYDVIGTPPDPTTVAATAFNRMGDQGEEPRGVCIGANCQAWQHAIILDGAVLDFPTRGAIDQHLAEQVRKIGQINPVRLTIGGYCGLAHRPRAPE